MDTLIQRLLVTFHHLRKKLDQDMQAMTSYPVTRTQFILLLLISREGSPKLARLAEEMNVQPSAITVLIDRLEKLNYVKRITDPDDRRSVRVELTPLGREIIHDFRQRRRGILKSYLNRLSEEEIRTLTELLEKIANGDPFDTEGKGQ
ncbi:MarR family winged helix-turn-helix transcriptional regulator [Caldibacillus debilis]|uniref:MarR family winged helix-turn-helix transcriptional regulator n=1 Tax=Caldibacillus debilis TaxID=301148 RepID=UPI000E3A68F4|nr:MarR family transcriptional regulator [Caldibacillus debilis]REJ26708.1 MAG: MarR family transcriptional regulator [Caldibacillus debilis]